MRKPTPNPMQRARQLTKDTPYSEEISQDFSSSNLKSASKKNNYQVRRGHNSSTCGQTSMSKVTSTREIEQPEVQTNQNSSTMFPGSFMKQEPMPQPCPSKPALDCLINEVSKTTSEAKLQTPASALKGSSNNMLRQFITGSKRPVKGQQNAEL